MQWEVIAISNITVSMTPAYYDNDHMLLRAQLHCLSVQTCKDFNVYMIDPHYYKRKNIIPELAEKYKLDIIHIPYTPNTHIAKKIDCAVWNATYCYSKSSRNVRYSCWRFAKKNFVETIANAPSGMNIHFGNFLIRPPEAMSRDAKHRPRIANGAYSEDYPYTFFWNLGMDRVNWSIVDAFDPKICRFVDKNGNKDRTCYDNNTPHPPVGVYGNAMWCRDQWIKLNGVNEVITNSFHWEDIDFCRRARIYGLKIIEKSLTLFKMWHQHGAKDGYANVDIDTRFTSICNKCDEMLSIPFTHCVEPSQDDIERFRPAINGRKDSRYNKILWHPNVIARAKKGEVFVDENMIFVCRECGLSGALGSLEYQYFINQSANYKAPILNEPFLIGRNLEILVDDMDRCQSLSDKIDVYNDSWINRRYYQKEFKCNTPLSWRMNMFRKAFEETHKGEPGVHNRKGWLSIVDYIDDKFATGAGFFVELGCNIGSVTVKFARILQMARHNHVERHNRVVAIDTFETKDSNMRKRLKQIVSMPRGKDKINYDNEVFIKKGEAIDCAKSWWTHGESSVDILFSNCQTSYIEKYHQLVAWDHYVKPGGLIIVSNYTDNADSEVYKAVEDALLLNDKYVLLHAGFGMALLYKNINCQ